MANYYPPVGFSFSVSIGANTTGVDASFSEVSGLDTTQATVDLAEGGENRFTHKLPMRAGHPDLVLKRGVMVAQSALFTWAKQVLEGGLAEPIKPQPVLVSLLDQTGAPMLGWSLDRAWPVKWSIAAFDARKGEIAMETLELSYAAMTRKLFRTKPATGMLKA
ncbi:MAG: phage tail protein [Paracoccaceae bacterium]